MPTLYFKYLNGGTYRTSGQYGTVYLFEGGNPVAVSNRIDQVKYACNESFIEVDASGEVITPSIPSCNRVRGGEPRSYTSVSGSKGAARAASTSTVTGVPGAKTKESEEAVLEAKKLAQKELELQEVARSKKKGTGKKKAVSQKTNS